MGFVMYTTCDFCDARIDDKRELEDAEVSIANGRMAVKLCTECQRENTVFAAKDYLRTSHLRTTNQTKGPPDMTNKDNDPDAPKEVTAVDATADTAKAETVEELRAKIAELEGKDRGDDEDDTDTKPPIETNNKFGVNTRDGAIIVGNHLALVNGVSVADAINLAAWLSIVADRNTEDDEGLETNSERFSTIVEANPES